MLLHTFPPHHERKGNKTRQKESRAYDQIIKKTCYLPVAFIPPDHSHQTLGRRIDPRSEMAPSHLVVGINPEICLGDSGNISERDWELGRSQMLALSETRFQDSLSGSLRSPSDPYQWNSPQNGLRECCSVENDKKTSRTWCSQDRWLSSAYLPS